MLKRPSKHDTEDELMQMQQELLQGNAKPAAEVIRCDKRKSVDKSDYESEKQKQLKSEASADNLSLPMIVDDDITEKVLFDITERDIGDLKCLKPSVGVQSFPIVVKHSSEDLNVQVKKDGNRKKSIFAQQMEKMKKTDPNFPSRNSASAENVPVYLGEVGSVILEGSGLHDKDEVVKIHNENINKIENMMPEEIHQHRKELISHIDAKTLEFLKSLRKARGIECNRKKTLKNFAEANPSDVLVYVTKSHKDVNKDEFPIPLDGVKKFMHMDTVELDKLSWMTMLPKPIDKKTGFAARFNFEGRLLLPSAELVHDEGMHHHGEDQELPGYTLEELYHLARSAFPAQQVIALRTLAKILVNNWLGLFDESFEESLLTQLVESGFVILLRLMLDKSDESTVAAAVYALYSLLVNEVDQMCLDKVFPWSFGHHSPFLKPSDVPEGSRVDSETKIHDLTDDEIVKMDVIKGLLRMDLLPRLRYILDIMKLEAVVVGHILGILIRISQHSSEGASLVMECPHLIETIFSQFLPSSWGAAESVHGKLSTVYKIPLYPAVCLMRFLASSGRFIASRLVSDYKIMDVLMCYLTLDPSDQKLPVPDALKLNLESLRTWKTLLSYGLAMEIYQILYPVLMKQLQYCQTLSLAVPNQDFEFQYASQFLSCLESIITIAGTNMMKRATLKNESWLSWEQVCELEIPARMLFGKWIKELSTNTPSTSGLAMISCCTSLLASYYEAVRHLPGYNAVDITEKFSDLMKLVVLPFLNSDGFKNLSSALSMHSCIMYNGKNGNERDAKTLCSLGSVMWASDVSPILQDGTPFPLFLALAKYLFVCSSYCFELENEVMEKFLCNKSVMNYVKNVINIPTSYLSSHWFTRFETFYLSFLVLLSAKKAKYLQQSVDITFYHCLSLVVPSWILPGDSYMVHRLLSSAIFHPDFYFDGDDLSMAVQMIETEDPFPLLMVNGEELLVSEGKIISDTCRDISDIRSVYVPFSECVDSLERSWQRIENQCYDLESLSTFTAAKKCFHEDWIFIPILSLYDEVQSGKFDHLANTKIMDVVVKCLQWIHFLITFREQSFFRLSPASVFTDLATVFLVGNDLFLDTSIHQALYSALKQLLKRHPAKSFDFLNVTWFEKRTFLDCYKELLDQFEAVSYGNQLFSCFVILPLQQVYGASYKKLLFEEHTAALRLLSISLQKILIPIKNFLYPLETDIGVMTSYCKLLISEQLQPSPLLYLIAIHHLNNFLISDPQTKLKSSILTKMWTLRHKTFAHSTLHYKNPDETKTMGFEESVDLPANVIAILQRDNIQIQ